jgi:hypothetical protein
MPTDQPLPLPPLDSSLLESLRRLASRLALNDRTLLELAWVAFYRNWEVAMLEAWARAKKSAGDRLPIPAGFEARLAPIDPMSAWAYAELGLRNGVLPGGAVFGEGGWGEIDGRPVSGPSFRSKTKHLVREHAARYPNGTLAKQLAALEAERRRARMVMALTARPARSRVVRSKAARMRGRRSPRRVHLGAAHTRPRRGADPPDPEPPTFQRPDVCTLERTSERSAERGRSP